MVLQKVLWVTFPFSVLIHFENVESFKILNNIIFLQFFILIKHY